MHFVGAFVFLNTLLSVWQIYNKEFDWKNRFVTTMEHYLLFRTQNNAFSNVKNTYLFTDATQYTRPLYSSYVCIFHIWWPQPKTNDNDCCLFIVNVSLNSHNSDMRDSHEYTTQESNCEASGFSNRKSSRRFAETRLLEASIIVCYDSAHPNFY